MQVFAKTDIGKVKKENQDYYEYTVDNVGVLDNLFILADGMGGYKSGDFASKFTTEKIKEDISNTTLEDIDIEGLFYKVIVDVDRQLVSKSATNEEYEGMGTTVVLATIKDGRVKISNVGDSRLYLYSNGSLKQVTEDHSLVNELYQLGQISKEELKSHEDKHKITRAIGYGSEPDFYDVDITDGDYILLCSDGLSNMVDDNTIKEIVEKDITLEDKCNELIKLANDNGGLDNITVMIVQI